MFNCFAKRLKLSTYLSALLTWNLNTVGVGETFSITLILSTLHRDMSLEKGTYSNKGTTVFKI